MNSAVGILRAPVTGVLWTEFGAHSLAWELPPGSEVVVDAVISATGGLLAEVHGVDEPCVSAVVELRDLAVAGVPVPF
ncbi:hypothetical protein GCM10010174_03340 [Kutzneria viridogrisea]|uniref:Uncharacterized protein n=1 Tax=Kutzneria viridogrisea TaxID=47990 RepID=A0ABR6BR90_9PSEU|nr:hypothetical protein [Kutzneria viridogrisea]